MDILIPLIVIGIFMWYGYKFIRKVFNTPMNSDNPGTAEYPEDCKCNKHKH